jgi:hypothetical protein
MATKEQRKLEIGSRSSGSLRDEDWAGAIDTMLHELSLVDDATFAGFYEAWDHHGDEHECDTDDCPGEYMSEAISDAIDVLQEYAPIYCYVGSAECDGADFGVWPSHYALQGAIANGVPDGDDVINEEDGVRINVSDHGNIEVYDLATGRSLLAMV